MPVFVQQEGQQTGPFEDADVVRHLQEGTLTLSNLAWEDGLLDWTPLGQIREFGNVTVGLARTPPPIRSPQPPPFPGTALEPGLPAAGAQPAHSPTSSALLAPSSPKMSTGQALRWIIGIVGAMTMLLFLAALVVVMVEDETREPAGVGNATYSAPAPPQSSREEPRTESQSGLGGVLSELLESDTERHARTGRQLLGVWDSEDGWQRMEFKPDGRIIMTELKDPNTPPTTGRYVLNANAALLTVRLDGIAGVLLDALDSNEDEWLLIISNDRMILPRPLAGTAYRRAR